VQEKIVHRLISSVVVLCIVLFVKVTSWRAASQRRAGKPKLPHFR
jgi:hypothetical protein